MKFSVPMCTSERITYILIQHYVKLSRHSNSNRSLSASVPLMAIDQTIQEIKVLRKHRQMNQMAVWG